ncbi:MAG: MFS transporter [Planctomycetota bacterium]|jgi:MFS family permease
MAEKEAGSIQGQKWLFWTCFISLVATSFGFIVRAQIIGDWGADFNLSKTQQGEIFGVGLWPFAISIVLFSLIIDKIGYGRALAFAFLCHVASAIITIMADGYWMLYWGTFILALGNGTVEAVINPVVATIFTKDKTKWLNILHAGWPGGLVLGGLLALIMGPETSWKWKVGLILIPVAIYGIMLIKCKFPIHERVKAGVSYKAMLQEAGIIGAAIVVIIMTAEVGRVFVWPDWLMILVAVVTILIYGFYVRSLGRPMFIFLLLIMVPLATTELGTDSWITELVQPVMVENLGLQAGWLLVYTAFIMMVLRFIAGPIVHRLSPLGLLAVSSLIAVLGLIALSKAAGIAIFLAATLYALGKTFFWPTMLGVAAEQFPKGGALTLNAIGGMGMLSVGVIGTVFLGNIQDKQMDSDLLAQNPAIHAKVIGEEKVSVFGKYKPIDQEKLQALAGSEKSTVSEITASAKKNALMTVAIFPFIMLICYLILIFYFKAKGGYKPVDLET